MHAITQIEHGRYLEFASLDGNNVRVSRVPLQPADLISAACALLDRNLTLPEWSEYLGPAIPYQRTCPALPMPPN